MIGLTIEPEDGKGREFDGFAAQAWEHYRGRAVAVVRRVLVLLESTAKRILSAKGSGRIYGAEQRVAFATRAKEKGGGVFSRKGTTVRGVAFTANRGKVLGGKGRRGSRVHQASAPGEPPAVDTGKFRNSVTHEPPTVQAQEVRGRWGSVDVRAALFEFGGMTGRGRRTRILARPWARPTEEQARQAVDSILEEI